MKVRRKAQRRKSGRVHTSSPLRRNSYKKSAPVALSLEGGEEPRAEQEKNKTCILCCENKPVTLFSDEHVFPKAIGGKLILKDTVCRRCNGHYVDAADSHLVKHVVIKLDRLVCQIKGVAGRRPKPFESSHTDGTERHTEKGQLIKAEKTKLLSTGEKIETPTTKNGLPFSGRGTGRVTDVLEKIVQSIGQGPEKANAEKDLEAVRGPEGIRANPGIRVPTTFDVVKYKKGILKIAYELACYWLGQPYLNDPIGHKIRQALKDHRALSQSEGVDDLKWKIDLIATASTIPFWDDKPGSHVAFLIPSQEGLTVYVRVFKAFEGILEISQSPERYQVEEGKFIEMDTHLDEMKQSTLFQQLASL